MPRLKRPIISLLFLPLAVVAQGSCDRYAGSTTSANNAASTPGTTRTTTQTKVAGSTATPTLPPDKLFGTWVAHGVDSKLGDVRIRLTLKEEGPVKIAAWSELPFIGQVRDKTATYEVNGHTLTSDAIRGGTSVKYWFEGEQLVIEYEDGKTVKFTRQ